MATKTHIADLQSLVHEACRIYHEQLISQSDEHPTENAYNALYQFIRQDIATHHPNSDFILVNQYIH